MVTLIKTRLPKIEAGAQLFESKAGTRFQAKAGKDATDVDLYDEIGAWGVTARDFRTKLKAIDTPVINLRINSPGGNVFDGIAMFNDLVAHPAKVKVQVTGLAASAASLIAMAGDEIEIASNAFIMIHNAWAVAIGDSREMDRLAKVLTRINVALAGTYVERTGLSEAEIRDMMDDETWLSADEALEAGFADRIGEAADAKAAFDLSVFKNAPESLAARVIERSEPNRDRSNVVDFIRQFGNSVMKGYSDA